ncbi:FadR/GntR family transcriptional regulator [Sphingorhabdus sp.]|uniref:FadR/GntR family transcriptional regulator n=1 Tax=Sphingorhabdus sp. TaxID=1902408 RepID=UPI0035B215C3
MKSRLYKSIVSEILTLIDEGIFPPGSRLPGERELAERFDVSRVTIREAEIALEALGHIVIKTGSGAYVQRGAGSPSDALPNVTAFELTAARAVIEAEAAALAAANMTDEGIAHLDGLIEAMSSVVPNGSDEGDDIDRQFHLSIARMSGNPVIEFNVQQLWRIRNELPQVQKVYSSVCVTDAKARTDEHASICAALRDRDPAAARLAMREHFHRLFEAMLVATENRAVEEVKRKIGEDRQRFLVTTQI